MKVWLPLAILLSVGWLLFVRVLVSHGDDGSVMRLAVDPAGLLRQSHAAMLGLDSLQAEMTTQWEGRDYTDRVLWQNPDSFHVLSPYVVAHMESGQKTQISDYGFVEGIAVGDRMYTRQCAEEDQDCQPWGEGLRDGTWVPLGETELDPFWTIELLGQVSDAQVVGREKLDGVACVRIQGNANIMRAMVQSWRRAEATRGPLYWGEECTMIDSDAGAEEDECHTLSLDEYVASVENSVRQQDQDPPSVEVWVGRDDGLLRRLEFPPTLAEESGGSFRFSRFDAVTVEPPR